MYTYGSCNSHSLRTGIPPPPGPLPPLHPAAVCVPWAFIVDAVRLACPCLVWLCFPQAITKNMAHPFCIRQYASFQDKHHLYFLFDLMPGGDLMDVLVAEAKIIKHPVPQKGSLRQGCLAPKVGSAWLQARGWGHPDCVGLAL